MDDQVKTAKPEEMEIDLLELLTVIWNKFWLVIIGAIVGAAAAFVLVTYGMTPKYKATSTIYIFSKTTSITSLADLQIGSQLTQDFQIIAKTRGVVESAIGDLEAQGKLEPNSTTYESLVNRISVSNPASSHMLQITVEDTDPIRAANFSNMLSDKLRDQISEIMNTDRPSVVQRALAPKEQSSPSVKRDVVIGGMLGALLVMAVLVIRHLMDDTIKISDDVHKYLGLDVLAEFPVIRDQAGNRTKGRGGKYNNRRHASAVSR